MSSGPSPPPVGNPGDSADAIGARAQTPKTWAGFTRALAVYMPHRLGQARKTIRGTRSLFTTRK